MSGKRQAGWEPLDQPSDGELRHSEAEREWLGFESQEVIDRAAEIRSQWTEEECRVRAAVPCGVLFRVLGTSICYDPVSDVKATSRKKLALLQNRPTSAAPSGRVQFGTQISRTMTGAASRS